MLFTLVLSMRRFQGERAEGGDYWRRDKGKEDDDVENNKTILTKSPRRERWLDDETEERDDVEAG